MLLVLAMSIARCGIIVVTGTGAEFDPSFFNSDGENSTTAFVCVVTQMFFDLSNAIP